MPYQGYADGLYLIKRKSTQKGVDHYGVLDIGNRIHHPQVDGINPVVIHKGAEGIFIDWFQDTGSWNVIGKVTDEMSAIERLNLAFQNPQYDLFGNNCEHFARYITIGKRESTQIQAAGIAVGLAALAIFVLTKE